MSDTHLSRSYKALGLQPNEPFDHVESRYREVQMILGAKAGLSPNMANFVTALAALADRAYEPISEANRPQPQSFSPPPQPEPQQFTPPPQPQPQAYTPPPQPQPQPFVPPPQPAPQPLSIPAALIAKVVGGFVVFFIIVGLISSHPSPSPVDNTTDTGTTTTDTGTDTSGTTSGESVTGAGTSTGGSTPPPPDPRIQELLDQRSALIKERDEYHRLNQDYLHQSMALDDKANDLGYQIARLQIKVGIGTRWAAQDPDGAWNSVANTYPEEYQQRNQYEAQIQEYKQQSSPLFAQANEYSTKYVNANAQLTQVEQELQNLGWTQNNSYTQ